jgi:hypothetical protein
MADTSIIDDYEMFSNYARAVADLVAGGYEIPVPADMPELPGDAVIYIGATAMTVGGAATEFGLTVPLMGYVWHRWAHPHARDYCYLGDHHPPA